MLSPSSLEGPRLAGNPALEKAGWIERQDGGYLAVSAKARHDLSPATEATLRYLVAVGAACVAAAGRGPVSNPPAPIT